MSVLLDMRPQGPGSLGSYIRFAPGPITLAKAVESDGVIGYYGTHSTNGYVDISSTNMRAIELIPGQDELQDIQKKMILSRFPPDMDEQARELVWYALQAGRRDKH